MKILNKLSSAQIPKKITTVGKNINSTISTQLKSTHAKVKTSAVAALFLLPTLGTVGLTSCHSNKENNTEIVDKSVDMTKQENYVDIIDKNFHIVNKGDNLSNIAKENNVSITRLIAENEIDNPSLINIGDTIKIPSVYTVKNINNIDDVANMTGFRKEFLENMSEMEGVHNSMYVDRNNNKTIGIGHLIKNDELEKYKNKTLSESEVYTIFAQDILNCDLDFKTLLSEENYLAIPVTVKESVIDLIFNKGLGAVKNNENIMQGLNEQDYEKVISNLTQDYSLVKDKNGKTVKKYASGLSKRRLYDISNASKMYKTIPQTIKDAANNTYLKGLEHLENEYKKGEYTKEVYENVKAEYKTLAYTWFNGEIGENLQNKDIEQIKSTPKQQINTSNVGQKIYINEKETDWSVETLYKDWEKTAKKHSRPFVRPYPIVDKNGNIKADVKIFEPKCKGILSGKTIIINPGHGGIMGGQDGNVNFDPGTSNAKMSKKNPNIETNEFIGNGGKAVEEWVVNQNFAEELTNKITNNGGKVIYVQGSVYTAMEAIRNLQKNNSINLIISLHSNSSKNSRGIFIIANKRNGKIDVADKEFAKLVADNLNKDSWFNGITKQTEQSLGVLSLSDTETSPVTGVMIETGNLKNETDVANLNSRDFKTKFMDSVFESIKTHLTKN